MNYTFDIAGIPQLDDPFAYKPTVVTKSDAIKRMQAKFSDSLPRINDNPPPKKVFRSQANKAISTTAYANEGLYKLRQPTDFINRKTTPTLKKEVEAKVAFEPVVRKVEAVVVKQDSDPACEEEPVPVPTKVELKEEITRTSSLKKKPSTHKKVTAKKNKPAEVPKEEDQTKPRGWEFGKKKHFVRHASSPGNDRAAVQIQRIARGGMARIRYKLQHLQHLLDTRRERTDAAVSEVQESLAHRKDAFLRKMRQQDAKESRKLDQVKAVSEESQNIITYLRKENRKLREKNDEIAIACKTLMAQNARLEEANKVTEDNFKILREHTAQIEETHRRLMEVIPQYVKSIEILEEAVATRDAYCLAEHKIKVMYTKLMGDVVGKIEGNKLRSKYVDNDDLYNENDQLEETVMECCLELDGKEHDVPLPAHLEDKLNCSYSQMGHASMSMDFNASVGSLCL